MAATGRNDVPRPIAGLIFVLFWAIAIVLWCFVGSFTLREPRRYGANQ